MEETRLPKEFQNREGEIVVIQDMDDYYLRNAFNYALRRLKAVKDFVKWMSDKMEHMDEWETEMFCEKHRWAHHLEVLNGLPHWIEALGREAESRGTMSACDNCEGKGIRIDDKGKEQPCMICCGTGWVLRGVKVKEV